MSNSGERRLASRRTKSLMLGRRYFIRVSISRRIADVNKEKDIWVHSFRMPPDSNNSIKMEVGIEDCLHIEFEYNKSKYGLFRSGAPVQHTHNRLDTISKMLSLGRSIFYWFV